MGGVLVLCMKMLDFLVWGSFKSMQNRFINEMRSVISNMLGSKAAPESNIEPQVAGK